jgi:hypothetical protein
MENETSKLRKALQVVFERSGRTIECCDIGDVEDADEELFARILQGKNLTLSFPGEVNDIDWPISDFVRQAAECDSIAEGKLVNLRTSNLAIQLVSPITEMAHALVFHEEPLSIETANGIKVSLQHKCLPVAVFASNAGAYIDDFHGVVSSYQAIEADFSSFTDQRTEKYERDIIDAYLFELASSHDAIFSMGDFVFESSEPSWIEEEPQIRLRPLEDVNEGLRLFLAAVQINDPELRFFSFYKVLEHFGPAILNIEAHECLRKKLASRSALSPSGRFIREVLQLSKSFDQRKNDRELIKGVLLKGVDLVELNGNVPEAFRRDITYDTPSKDLDNYSRDLAEHICATRNQVAHAKGSYTRHGTECEIQDLAQFTEFVQAGAAQVIRWYNRLPDHLKTNIKGND